VVVVQSEPSSGGANDWLLAHTMFELQRGTDALLGDDGNAEPKFWVTELLRAPKIMLDSVLGELELVPLPNMKGKVLPLLEVVLE